MTIDNNTTKVITGKVRLSYANLFKPRSAEAGAEPKYSCSILIPKDDEETLRKIRAAIKAAYEEGKDKLKGKTGKLPALAPLMEERLRDGDEDRPDDEAYANCYFVNASSQTKPGIAKPIGKDANGKTQFQEITDSTEVYSGCYARVSLNFFAYNNVSRGISAGLNNIVKVQDGEFLGGRASLDDDFADTDFDDDYDDEDYMN